MQSSAQEYARLADEIEANLNRDILPMWYPRAMDEANGGFHENYAEDWSPTPDMQRSVVYQSRLTWLAAQAVLRYPDRKSEFAPIVEHGITYLADTIWDRDHGGLFWAVTPDGKPETPRGGQKHAYGIAFAIYAAAAAYHAIGDPRALDLAQQSFRWLEHYAHDSENLGYFESLTRAGETLLAPTAEFSDDSINTMLGLKSMNTHIHLLEAYTSLQEIWPDPALIARLEELFVIVRDKVAVPEGYLELYFKPDWTRVDGGNSYGHDVETAFLLAEAAHALGRPDDPETWRVAKHLVDHALEYGWDDEHGGFFDHGHPNGKPTVVDKIWWVQAEGLNALLLLHEKFGAQDTRYWDAFLQQWSFIETHQIDKTHRGWYEHVTPDGKPIPGNRKSDGWTECYHQGRAMLNVSSLLKKLASEAH